jgi:hypothetical protein
MLTEAISTHSQPARPAFGGPTRTRFCSQTPPPRASGDRLRRPNRAAARLASRSTSRASDAETDQLWCPPTPVGQLDRRSRLLRIIAVSRSKWKAQTRRDGPANEDTQNAPRGSEGVGHRVPASIRKWLPSLCQRTLSVPLCACAAWRRPLTHSLTGALQKPRSTACWRLPSLPVGPVRSWFGLGTTARNVHLHAPHGQGLDDCLGLALPAGRHIPMLDGRLHPAGSTL